MRRVAAEVDEVDGARCKFQCLLASQLYAESLLVQVLELVDAFGRGLRQEEFGLRRGFDGHASMVASQSP